MYIPEMRRNQYEYPQDQFSGYAPVCTHDTVVVLLYKTIETDYFRPKIIPGEPEIANDMRLRCVLESWKALLLAKDSA